MISFHSLLLITCFNYLLLLINLIAPANAVVFYNGSDEVNEGSMFQILCETSQIHTIKWRKDLLELSSIPNHYNILQDLSKEYTKRSIITIFDAQLSDTGNYTCTLEQYDNGHFVNVIRGIKVTPVYTNNTNYIKAEFRKPLNIECRVSDINTNFTISWLKNNESLKSSERLSVTDKIRIENAKEEDHGIYRCNVMPLNVTRDTVPLAHADVDVKFYPYVYIKEKDQTVIEEHTLNITCRVYGHLNEVQWRFENENQMEVERNVSYIEENGVKNSVLQIKSANKTDRGYYICSGPFGREKTNEARSFVRVKGKYAALWPFLGICAEVLILCTIIFIYEKRRDKTEMEESDTDQGPETKSSPDHGADSIRHRK